MEPSKVILSADSTCDLPAEVKERYNVHYYPFHIILRDQMYQDNVDIFPQDLFEAYYKDGALPTTGASSIQEFIDHFTPFLEQGYEVIHLSLGSSLSSAYTHAMQAAEQLEGAYVIDSGNLSVGMAPQIVLAGKLIEQGLSAAEIVPQVEALRANSHMSFVLDTMDFLAAGGRCPQVLAHAGKMLKLHPSIEVHNHDASMSVDKLYRGKPERVAQHYLDDVLKQHANMNTEEIFFVHTLDDEDTVKRAVEYVRQVSGAQNIYISKASCTISSHCGPNVIGLAYTTA